MAGKHIYIETILDNLLGGFQTTFDKMIAALDRMIGKTEEDPDGTSLKQVVTSVESLMGENDDKKNLYDVVGSLEIMTNKLDEEIEALADIVALTSPINPYIRFEDANIEQNFDSLIFPAHKTGNPPRYYFNRDEILKIPSKFLATAEGTALLRLNFKSLGELEHNTNGTFVLYVYDDDGTTVLQQVSHDVRTDASGNIPDHYFDYKINIPQANHRYYFAFKYNFGYAAMYITDGTQNGISIEKLSYSINNVITDGILIQE